MTKKLTQEELEQAWKQMEEERKADYQRAASACRYLRETLHLGEYGVSILSNCDTLKVSPKPHSYTLCVSYRSGKEERRLFDSETEIPLLENLVAKLTATSGIRQLPKEGWERRVFEIDTPFGTYKVRLEHIDDG